jgi:diketogulonate reductase-like aldo/keto reductase
MRDFCREHAIVYQGFSLLTANQEVLQHPLTADLAKAANATPAQIIFNFARNIGILPLTGTSDAEHMKQDLNSRDLLLTAEALGAIESISG